MRAGDTNLKKTRESDPRMLRQTEQFLYLLRRKTCAGNTECDLSRNEIHYHHFHRCNQQMGENSSHRQKDQTPV